MLADEAVLKVFEDLGLKTQADRDRFLFMQLNAIELIPDATQEYALSDVAVTGIRMEAPECQQTGENS
ncbi:MAG: hypothetical protein ABIG44_04915 [Planctomycetota bacterium]